MPQFPAMQGFDVSEGLLARAAQSAAMPDRKQSPMQGFLAAKAAKKEEELKQAQFAEQQRQFGVTSDRADKQFDLTREQLENTIANQRRVADQAAEELAYNKGQDAIKNRLNQDEFDHKKKQDAKQKISATGTNYYNDADGNPISISFNEKSGKWIDSGTHEPIPDDALVYKSSTSTNKNPMTSAEIKVGVEGKKLLGDSRSFIRAAVDALDFIDKNPNINTAYAGLTNVLSSWKQEGLAIATDVFNLSNKEAEDLFKIREYDSADEETGWGGFEALGTLNAEYKSLLIGLAFKRAAAQQGRNSISDKDIKMILKELGANNANPRAMVSVLKGMSKRVIADTKDYYALNKLEDYDSDNYFSKTLESWNDVDQGVKTTDDIPNIPKQSTNYNEPLIAPITNQATGVTTFMQYDTAKDMWIKLK